MVADQILSIWFFGGAVASASWRTINVESSLWVEFIDLHCLVQEVLKELELLMVERIAKHHLELELLSTRRNKLDT